MFKLLFVFFLFIYVVSSTIYFQETFDDSTWEDRWVVPDREGLGPFTLSTGDWYADGDINSALKTSKDASFYGISASFDEFKNAGKTLVIQLSVKHEQDIDCGGGYVKVAGTIDQSDFNGETDYNIMFGPDICGNTKRVHVIFNYDGDNKLIEKTIPCETDVYTHVYTLIVNDEDKTYEVLIDGESMASGSLVDDWAFLSTPSKIKDPEQSKPDDWSEQPMMNDPDDVKPEGYDDLPRTIADPAAVKPEDWDDEDDGEWEAPMINNPEYNGPWSAKQIPDPNYKGKWEHPLIANPEFEMDDSIAQYTFGTIGIDVWQVKSGTLFDNILITDSIDEAAAFRAKTFDDLDEKNAFKEYQAELAMAATANEPEEEEDEYDDEEEDDEDLHDEL